MKKTPTQTNANGVSQNYTQRGCYQACLFLGTENHRYLRAIHALWVSPQARESIEHCAGCSNGPELVAELLRGLEVPCEKTPCIDRDGFDVNRGIYYLTPKDRRLIRGWKNRRKGKLNE